MSYTRGVPQATDRIPNTQGPIQTNFNLLDSDLGVDHYSPSGLSNQATPGANIGYHYKVTLPANSAPTSLAGQAIIYGKQDASTQTFPYMVRDAASVPYPVVPIHAFCSATVSGGAVTLTQAVNVLTIDYNLVGNYQVNIPNHLKNNAYIVLITVNGENMASIDTWTANYYSQNVNNFRMNVTKVVGLTGSMAADPFGFSLAVVEI
jgi:hypothetical protein